MAHETPLAQWARQHDTPAELFTLHRTGDLDIVFDGWLAGRAAQTVNGYFTAVAIYITQGGQLVASVERQAPGGARRYATAALPSAEQALRWLAESNRGRLGDLAKQAWLSACSYVPPLATHAQQRIA